MRSAVVLAVGLVLTLCVPLHAVEIPNTTVGKAFNEWLAMLERADDEAAVRTYLETRLAERFLARGPMDEHVAMAREIAAGLAGFEAAVIESSTDLELSVVGQDNDGEWGPYPHEGPGGAAAPGRRHRHQGADLPGAARP